MTKLKATLTTSSQTHISTVTAEYFYTKEHGYWNCAKTKKIYTKMMKYCIALTTRT